MKKPNKKSKAKAVAKPKVSQVLKTLAARERRKAKQRTPVKKPMTFAAENRAAAGAQPTLPLDRIKIGDRHRKDFGDIGALARSINDRGALLHPIVVTPKHELIAGERRMRAWRQSRFKAEPIPVHVVDIDSIIAGEWDENAQQKAFTPSEAVAIKRALEPILKSAASAAAAARPSSSRPAPGRKGSGEKSGRAADKAAAFVGKDRRTVDRAEEIVEAAEQDPKRFGKLRDDMDRTGNVSGPFKRLRNMRQADAIRSAPAPMPMQGPYGGVVIDIPWPQEADAEQDDIDDAGRSLRPYAAMSIQTACRFLSEQVKPILAENCVVGLWVTNFHMRHAFQCLHALGIDQHSTIRTWRKDKIGRGQVFRDQTEHCIIGLIGKPVITLTNQTTIFDGPRRENSRKPDEFYADFETVFPATRYAEIFSRGGRSENWDCHGDQVGKFAPAVARAAEAELIEEANGADDASALGEARSEYQSDTLGMPYSKSYRSTPDGEAKVPDLVKPGMIVTTNYETGPYRVVSVDGPFIYKPKEGGSFEHWSLSLCDPTKKKKKLKATAWINEVVAVGTRLLMLFESNDDEVLIETTAAPPMPPVVSEGEVLATVVDAQLDLIEDALVPMPSAETPIAAVAEQAAAPAKIDLLAFEHPAMGIECPSCSAAVGAWCKPTGIHAERLDATQALYDAERVQTETPIAAVAEQASAPVDDAWEDSGAPAQARAPATFVPTCRVCGCTEENACPCDRRGRPVPLDSVTQGCHWVEPDLCSACFCAPKAEETLETAPAAVDGVETPPAPVADDLDIPGYLRRAPSNQSEDGNP